MFCTYVQAEFRICMRENSHIWSNYLLIPRLFADHSCFFRSIVSLANGWNPNKYLYHLVTSRTCLPSHNHYTISVRKKKETRPTLSVAFPALQRQSQQHRDHPAATATASSRWLVSHALSAGTGAQLVRGGVSRRGHKSLALVASSSKHNPLRRISPDWPCSMPFATTWRGRDPVFNTYCTAQCPHVCSCLFYLSRPSRNLR